MVDEQKLLRVGHSVSLLGDENRVVAKKLDGQKLVVANGHDGIHSPCEKGRNRTHSRVHELKFFGLDPYCGHHGAPKDRFQGLQGITDAPTPQIAQIVDPILPEAEKAAQGAIDERADGHEGKALIAGDEKVHLGSKPNFHRLCGHELRWSAGIGGHKDFHLYPLGRKEAQFLGDIKRNMVGVGIKIQDDLDGSCA